MNIFITCLPKRTGTPINLPDDDYYYDDHPNTCFPCWKSKNTREGLIRLPTGPGRTFDDYLDPTSPVSIEALLAEQEEVLDHYYEQTDDEDVFIASRARRKYSLVSHTQEEDAQSLNENRISALLVGRPSKMDTASLEEEEDIVEPDNDEDQELLTVVKPIASTSTSSISSRVFAIKLQPSEEENTQEQVELMTDVTEITTSPTELKRTSFNPPRRTTSLSTSTTASSEQDTKPISTRTDFPATTLTRVPYQAIPIPSTTPPIDIHTPKLIVPTPEASAFGSKLSSHNTTTPFLGRRPSVVQAAQNLLGDKLEDFTEKLAFIKKNIIMSMDSEEEEELSENNHFYDTVNKQRNRKSLDNFSSNLGGEKQTTWDTFILPKFKKQTSASTSLLSSSRSNTNAAVPHKSQVTHNNEINGNIADLGETAIKQRSLRRFSNASFSNNDDSEEEIFDFKKVVAMSKNVRTFGEGVMGNGLRMLNNIQTRIKHANDSTES